MVELLIVFEDERCQVVHGNYDTYELLRAEQKTAASAPKATGTTKNGAAKQPATKVKKKRRFPYRKVEDLEAEIAAAETRLRELETLLASPDLYRDGEKVKETMRDFEETKIQLKGLYEHWEEAVEMN